MNPNGLVPTIQDGDFVLWESNSIMRYLVEKYGQGKLLPTTPEARANANRWMDWQLSTFNPIIVPLFFATIRTPPDKRDPKVIEAALDKSSQAWQIVDNHLEGNSRSGISRWVFGRIAGSTCRLNGPNRKISTAGMNV
jgi:glutathione S-transferase